MIMCATLMRIILTSLITILSTMSFGQTFEGFSTDERNDYHCLLQINPDSSITYIFDRDRNGIYAEYVGNIRRVTDSTYSVNAELGLGQFYMKSLSKDTFYIQLEPTIARALDTIEVQFPNQKSSLCLKGYDQNHQPLTVLKVPVDNKLFNSTKGSDVVKITVPRKNSITGKPISFTIPYGSAASITQGDKMEFEIKIKQGTIESIGKRMDLTGPIRLKVAHEK